MSIIATLRPAGNAGDQNDATAVTASVTNDTGLSQAVTLAIAEQALSASGLGSQAFDAVEFQTKATLDLTGATASAIYLVATLDTEQSQVEISGTGGWETSTPLDQTPTLQQWTGDAVDAVTLRVDAVLILPPGASATLSVLELKAELMQDSAFSRTARGLAGDTIGQGAAGAVAAGGTI